MNAVRILKALSFYVVLIAACLLLWLVYGFHKSVIQPVHNSEKTSEIMISDTSSAPDSVSDNPSSSVDRIYNKVSHRCLHMKNYLDAMKGNHWNQLVTVHHPVVNASCSRLSKGDKMETKRVKAQLKQWRSSISDSEFLRSLSSNCSLTRQEFKDSFYISSIEESFPIAFDMLVYYKEGRVQQYIRLLKYLYRPQNVYCIHIDDKSPEWWKGMLTEVASCFPNMVIASNPVVIQYATATILYGHMRCLKDLLNYKWKYVITLHATELPMVTNREIVKHLMTLKGNSFINKGWRADAANSQVKSWITYKVKSINNGKWVVLTDEMLDQVPHNITLYKSGSSANSALSRSLVEFIFTNHKAQDLLEWLKDVHSAVEFFFSTVNQMPESPGHSEITNDEELAHRVWSHEIRKDRRLCKDMKIVHDICIVSSADLPRLTRLSGIKKYWFFNKYFIDYDHVVMDCMEKMLIQRNLQEYNHDCT